MRVLFDAFWWTAGPMANRTVLRELIFAWRRIAPADELILATRKAHPEPTDLPVDSVPVPTRLFPHAVVNALELPLIAKRQSADVTIVHNYTPLFGRSCVFIHDLLFEEHPEWFSLKERAYFSAMGPLALRASHVATSSGTESARILRLHPKIGRVEAIGLAASPHLSQVRATPVAAAAQLSGFVLSVGRLNARKNLAVAIEGAMRASTVTSERPLLVVGSSEYSGAHAELPLSVRGHVADGRIVFLGKVSDGELRWLYEQADGLVFLSWDEGFGLPPVEALHFDTPVIASDIPVMREVVGAGGRLVEPDNPAQVAEAIDRLRSRGELPQPRRRESTENEWDAIALKWRQSIVTKLSLGS